MTQQNSVSDKKQNGKLAEHGKENGGVKNLSDKGSEVIQAKEYYFNKRVQLFEQHYDKVKQSVDEARAKGETITVTFKEHGQNNITTTAVKGADSVIDVVNSLKEQHKDLHSQLRNSIVARVNNHVWDLFRPLETDSTIELCDFEHPDGKDTFWHSSSHMLGSSLESVYGVDLTTGPATENGFYYDCYTDNMTFSDEKDCPKIEKQIQQLVKGNHFFQRIEISKQEALDMFQENKFKIEIIEGLPEGAKITAYRVGPMVDLCTGPHVPRSGIVKAIQVSKMAGSHWRGDVTKDPLQRVYGITFPDKDSMKLYNERMEEAKRRDHRTVGTQQDLFFFHAQSPGSCFFTEYGTRIFNNLIELVKQKYWEYNYTEVTSPNIYNMDLWVKSGHAAHYKQNMFTFNVEKQEYGLKPMNCPGHCLMFDNRVRSYRELPIRFAEFGVLHRNEYSGALHGLTRVRRFQQDDAHIFCRFDQITSEIKACLKMIEEMYDIFGLGREYLLSTRPEQFLGEVEVWNKAEDALETALNATGQKWNLDPGEGAFYGPKIDIFVKDALNRRFQCGTIQLDFQLPIRFDLRYVKEQGFEKPVIIHRAILGSVERMFGILTENYAGKWPFWLSPRQVIVCNIGGAQEEYAEQVKRKFRAAKFYVETDCRALKVEKKVREAQVSQFNYILIVGAKEAAAGGVNVRVRDVKYPLGNFKVDDVINVLLKEQRTFARESIFRDERSNLQEIDLKEVEVSEDK